MPPAPSTGHPFQECYTGQTYMPVRHRSGALTMSPLEQLFALEVEFHRRLRTEAPGTGDAATIHTSYALQAGYERLLQRIGRVTGQDIEAVREQSSLAGDARDVLKARDSVIRILGIRPIET